MATTTGATAGAVAADVWSRIRSVLYLQWPTIATSSLSIALFSWAIHTLTNIDTENTDWNSILISNVIPILFEISVGVLFMCLAGYLLMVSVDTINVSNMVTIAFMTVGLTLSILTVAINNYSDSCYDDQEEFKSITTPILLYTLIGSFFLIVSTCMVFVTYSNDTMVLYFSVFVSAIAMLLSVWSTGITRVSR